MRTLLFVLLAFSEMRAQTREPVVYDPPPEIRAKAIGLHRRLNILHFGGTAWDIAVLGVLIRRRTGQRIRDAVERRVRARFVGRCITAAGLLMILWAADLPLTVYRHVLGVRYGLSVQSWLPWFADVLKADLITGVVAVLLIAVVLAAAARWPTRWWIYGWALTTAVMIAGAYLTPLVFEPLFFRFEPLARSDPQLTKGLREVAARAGYTIPDDRIYAMDASAKTRAVNAYMTGFGQTRRIVIWDTTLAALSPPQVQTVFAHELGHYALHHIPKSLALGALGLLGLFWAVQFVLSRQIVRSAGPTGRGRDDLGSLPVAFATILIVTFMTQPLVNTYSRWQEHQADIYELEAMHGLVPDSGRNSAEVTLRMAEIDLEDPQPDAFIQFWLHSHPSAADRIRFAQTYDPWSAGTSPRYVRP